MDKRIFILLFAVMLIMPMVSAWDFGIDNFKDYNPTTETISIWDKGIPLISPDTKLAEVKLDTPKVNHVMSGSNILVWEQELETYTGDYDSFEKMITDIRTYDRNDKMKEVNKVITFKIKQISYVNVTDYILDCKIIGIDGKNGSEIKECSEKANGSHLNPVVSWLPFEKAEKIDKRITIGAFTNVEAGESIEWDYKILGYSVLDHWATWTANVYDNFDDASINATLWSVTQRAGTTEITEGSGVLSINNAQTTGATGVSNISSLISPFASSTNISINISSLVVNDGFGNCDANGFRIWAKNGTSRIMMYGATCGNFSRPTLGALPEINNAVWINMYRNSTTDGMLYLTNGTFTNGYQMTGTVQIEMTMHTDPNTGEYYALIGDIMMWSSSMPLSVTTALISPANNTNYSVSYPITFSANATAVNGNVTNMTLYIWNGGTKTNSTLGLTNAFNSSSWVMGGLTDANYTWNVLSCATNSTGGSECSFNTNRTFVVDTTVPSFVVTSPSANSSTLTAQTNISLNVASSDAHLSACWYNTNQNISNITYTCNSLANVSFTGGLQYTINVFANDTFGNRNSTSISYFLNYVVPAMTITTPIAEGGTHTVYFNVNATEIDQTNATVNYNGTAYPMTLISNDGTHAYFSKTLTAPLVTADANVSVNVDYFVNGVAGSTAYQNQTIINFAMDDCAITTGRVILNMSLNDEETNVLVNATAPNIATIEINLLVTSFLNSSNTWQFYKKWSYNNSVAVCVPDGLLNASSYRIDFTAGFDSTDHVREFYYMDNGTLDNTNYFNSYTDSTIDLMDLASADSTTFLFSFTDADGLEVDNALIHTFRNYIGEGLFREVERSKQDNNGETHVHLVEEDVIYYFMVTQNGHIIYTSDTYNAKCLSTPCAIKLSASPTETNWSIIDNDGGRYLISSDPATRIATLDFDLVESALINFSLYSYEGSTATLINTTSVTAMAGSLDLIVPLAYGNKTFFAVVYKDGVFVKSAWIDLTDRGQDYFGTFGAILGGILVLTMMLMAVSEGAGFIIFTVLALILVVTMKLVDLNWMALVSIVCAGGIILWKLMNRRNKPN